MPVGRPVHPLLKSSVPAFEFAVLHRIGSILKSTVVAPSMYAASTLLEAHLHGALGRNLR